MKINAIGEKSNNQKTMKQNSQPTNFMTNNVNDSFELKALTPNKLSFKGKESILLTTDEGLEQLSKYFSRCINREPHHAYDLTLIKNFALEVSEKTIPLRASIKFSWEPIGDRSMNFDNTRYIFENANTGFFETARKVYGSSESLCKLIKYLDFSNRELKKKEPIITKRNAIMRRAIKKAEKQNNQSEIEILNSLIIDTKLNAREKAAELILNSIRRDKSNPIESLHFDDIYPNRI